jgi:hypothetical protein
MRLRIDRAFSLALLAGALGCSKAADVSPVPVASAATLPPKANVAPSAIAERCSTPCSSLEKSATR